MVVVVEGMKASIEIRNALRGDQSWASFAFDILVYFDRIYQWHDLK